ADDLSLQEKRQALESLADPLNWEMIAANQVALHLEDLGASSIDQVPLNTRPEVCLHCAKPFGTLLALQQHIQTCHRTYSCVRDSQGGTAVCAHCGVDCKEHWNLRAHIDKNRCSNFNVHRQDSTALILDRNLHFHLLQGDIRTLLTTPEDAFHLTQVCTICMQQFRRAIDILRHLQQSHGEHFRLADPYHAVLLEFTQKDDCVCNPSPWLTAAQANRHSCTAYRQLAILHHHLNPDHRWLILPIAFTEEILTRVATWNPVLHSKAPALVQRLLRQELHQIWSDQTICQALKEHCSICTCHKTDLVEHLTHNHKAFLNEFPAVFRYLAMNLKRLGPCCTSSASMENMEGVVLTEADRLSQLETSLGESIDQLTRMLAILMIRHEDSLNSYQSQDSYIIHFNRTTNGLIDHMVQEASSWNERMKANTADLPPLRVHLAMGLSHQMITRFIEFGKAIQDPKIKQGALSTHLLLENNVFPYLKWDAHRKMTVPDNRPGIPLNEMEALLQRLQVLTKLKTNVVRFHSLQNMSKTTDVVPWRLQVSMRDQELKDVMDKLAANSV
ncbi:unnamed protein product, partial [Durusdinium trenchii]